MSYLQDQLSRCQELVKRKKELIVKYPDKFSLKMGLRSLEAHEKELVKMINEE